MKITSGIYKGKTLLVPRSGIKPTSDKVRQALFNIIRPFLKNAVFIDLYCGTGSVGIEALSNGARFCYFIDNSEKMYRILKKNLTNIVKDTSRYQTIKYNALHFAEALRKLENFQPPDFIFADPYYKDTAYQLEHIYNDVIFLLKPGGMYIVEHNDNFNGEDYTGFIECRHYGDTRLSLFRNTIEGRSQ